MQPVHTLAGRVILWALLIAFFLSSTLPFVWTIMQSLKTNLEASARTPIVWFRPTAENYSEIWLQSTNGSTSAILFGLLVALVILVAARLCAYRLPWSPRVTGFASVALIVAMFWSVPRLLDVTTMYDIFINSVVVSVATVVIASIALLRSLLYGTWMTLSSLIPGTDFSSAAWADAVRVMHTGVF